MVEIKDYQRSELSTWCPACGNFAIALAVKRALTALGKAPHEAVLISGVGCFAKLPYWIKANGFVGLHGRSLPVAQGVKLANPDLTVLAFGGDGDGYGEGGNHFMHACRRNVNLTYIVHNNELFGLTTGQYSPTSRRGYKSKSSPLGSQEKPVNPLALAISAGATFVARGYSCDVQKLVEIIIAAVNHPGFAFIDVLLPCVSFGEDYFKEKIYYLDEKHDFTDRGKALDKAWEEEKLPAGIFYKR